MINFENIVDDIIMPFDLKIGDRVELDGKKAAIIKIGRLGIPHALTLQWDQDNKVEVIFNEERCLSIVKVEDE